MTLLNTTRLALSVVDSIEAVGRARWADLAAASGAPVFYSYDFLRSVETHPLTHPSRALYLLAQAATGELLAALPVYLQQTHDPFGGDPGGARTTALLGHVWHCYDTTLPSRVPLDPWLVERFWSVLAGLAAEHRAQLWGLVNVARDGPLAGALGAIGVVLEETVPRYRLRVGDGPRTVDEHLAERVGRSSRRTLRRYWRRAERAGAVISRRPVGAGLDREVLELCLATADKHAPGYYPPDRLSHLLHRLGPACQILRVELAGTLLAASICLYDRLRMHAWAGGCHYPTELNWSPQYVLFAAELATGLGSGLPILECGRRNDEFKSRYGLTRHPLVRAVRRS